MKTTKILFLLLLTFIVSCSDNDEASIYTEESESSETYNKYYRSSIGVTWYLGRPMSGPHNGGCFAIGSCETIDNLPPFDIGFNTNNIGTAVEITLINDHTLYVKILEESVSIIEIQEIIDSNPNVNLTAGEIHNTLTSSVLIEGPLSLGLELSQQLLPNSNELIILSGDYAIDYSNSEFGEFNLPVQLN
jgi:hypothetical protein